MIFVKAKKKKIESNLLKLSVRLVHTKRKILCTLLKNKIANHFNKYRSINEYVWAQNVSIFTMNDNCLLNGITFMHEIFADVHNLSSLKKKFSSSWKKTVYLQLFAAKLGWQNNYKNMICSTFMIIALCQHVSHQKYEWTRDEEEKKCVWVYIENPWVRETMKSTTAALATQWARL